MKVIIFRFVDCFREVLIGALEFYCIFCPFVSMNHYEDTLINFRTVVYKYIICTGEMEV